MHTLIFSHTTNTNHIVAAVRTYGILQSYARVVSQRTYPAKRLLQRTLVSPAQAGCTPHEVRNLLTLKLLHALPVASEKSGHRAF